jgi:hypothetical protein
MAEDKRVKIVIEAESGSAEAALFRVKKALSDTSKETGSAASSMLTSFRDIGLALESWASVAQRAFGAVKSGLDMLRDLADINEMQSVFRTYAASVGKSADEMLEAIHRATKGQVDDLTIMRETMRAMKLGVSTDVQELAKLWEIAETKGDEFGRSTQETFAQMVDAIGRGSGRLLVDLGLIPENMGRASNAMDLLAKRADLLATVLRQGSADIGRLSGVGETAADHVAQLDAALANLRISLAELAPAFAPVVRGLRDLVVGAKEYLREYGLLSKPNPYIGKPIDALRRALERETERAARLNKANSLSPAAQESAQKVGLLTEAIRRTRELERAAASAAKATVEAAEKPKSAIKAIREEVDRAGPAIERVTREFVDGWGGKGVGSVDDARKVMLAAAAAAGGLAVSLRDGVTEAGRLAARIDEVSRAFVSGFAGDIVGGQALASLTPKSAAAGLADMMGVGWILRGEGRKPISADVERRAREVIEQPMARVFSDAMVEGLEGGDFFRALGRGMRRVVIESLAGAITGALFGQPGALAGPAAVATTGGAAGTGLIGGLLPPLRRPSSAGGGINWGGVAATLGVGAALSWLTSPGRIFGGRVIHGGEVPGIAADINQRVAAARQERDALLTTAIGLSRETAALLRDLQFRTAGYTASKSGDGIFSKKTTTYALDASAANESLARYAELAARAAVDVARRQYDIGVIELKSPIEALSMTISDLRDAIDRMGQREDTAEQRYAALLRLAQAERARTQQAIARTGQYYEFLLANPLGAEKMREIQPYSQVAGILRQRPFGTPVTVLRGAALGNKVLGPVYATPQTGTPSVPPRDMTGYDYAMHVATSWTSPDVSSGRVQLWPGGPSYTLDEIRTINDIRVMMAGIAGQAQASYLDQVAAIEAGSDKAKIESLLRARLERLNKTVNIISALMDSAAKAALNDAVDLQQRTAAFEGWQKAVQEYYAAKLEARQIEAEMLAADKAAAEQAKAELDKRTADILGTMLTHLGEVQTVGGRQVIVLSAGQPDARALAIELRDSLAGSNPELASVLGQFIDAVGRPRWG